MFYLESGPNCHWSLKSISLCWVTLPFLTLSKSLLLTGNIKQLSVFPHSYRVKSHTQCADETPIIVFDCEADPRPVGQKHSVSSWKSLWEKPKLSTNSFVSSDTWVNNTPMWDLNPTETRHKSNNHIWGHGLLYEA